MIHPPTHHWLCFLAHYDWLLSGRCGPVNINKHRIWLMVFLLLSDSLNHSGCWTSDIFNNIDFGTQKEDIGFLSGKTGSLFKTVLCIFSTEEKNKIQNQIIISCLKKMSFVLHNIEFFEKYIRKYFSGLVSLQSPTKQVYQSLKLVYVIYLYYCNS